MTIVGTRPEIIKLSCVIEELDKYTEHILVHTGQNYDYELNEIFFEKMKIRKPDVFLDAAGKNPAETIGNVIICSDKLMNEHKPDAVLFYGDTNSTMAVISAKKNKIPVFHMEAGNRCFDERVPEEDNRKIIDHLSDINMTVSEHARRYLLSEGIQGDRIFKIGSCMKEVYEKQKENIENSDMMKQLNLGTGEYFLVSCHREENTSYSQNFSRIVRALNDIAEHFNKRIIFSVHPRTHKTIEGGAYELSGKIEMMKPMGFADYNKLQKNAYCVISDSGTITEEAAILNFPAIIIRQTHERPEGIDEGVITLSGLESNHMITAIEVSVKQFHNCRETKKIVFDYDVGNVSEKVIKIILGYTDFINYFVWKKEK